MVSMQRNVLLVLCLATCTAARRGFRSSTALENNGAGTDNSNSVVIGEKDLLQESATKDMISAMVGQFLEEGGPGVGDILKAAAGKIDINDAVKKLEGRLPSDVASLVRLSSMDTSKLDSKDLNETSIQRARTIMNNMMYASIGDIDDLIFNCKEFQDRNRGTYEQVVNDVARLGTQLARLEVERVSSNQCMSNQDAATRRLEEALEVLTTQFNALRTTNSIELTRRRNDLAVFEFIMNATACPADMQLSLLQGKPSSSFSMCSSDDGMTLNFNNHKLQTELEKMMTPSARLALRSALGQVTPTLLEFEGGVANTSTSVVARASQPVSEAPNSANWRKCTDMPQTPHVCGKVHDTMSIHWGRFRDEVDELATQMARNRQEYEAQRNNLNEQITVATDSKSTCQEEYAASTSSINADTEEQNEKLEQKRQLTTEYDETCAHFRLQITTKIHEEVCMIVTVRNALLSRSSTTTPDNTIDCQTTDWMPKDGVCVSPQGNVILCDDTCPRSDPNLCGGTETMKRDILVRPSPSGVQCGVLERQKRCGQKKCPVDCSMSTWSGWSRCSRDCEGGVQLKTRSVIVRPMNGGRGCDVVQEERACNTGSCDRDCTLEDWTDWVPCSQACTNPGRRGSAGWTGRTRSVLVPIRGQGRCPRPRSRRRWGAKRCNRQACAGDEICIAKQDLVIALDASGSLREPGFLSLRNFTVNLTQRYEARYFGQDSVKMGAVLFGNGNITRGSDGAWTISDAIKLHSLTFDLPAVRSSLAASTWQYGFTNMAQALSAADFLLSRGGRESAQSAVLVLSDGRPSFAVQTSQKAQELKDRNIKIFMAPVMEFPTPSARNLKDWASHPWQTNYEQIPGIPALSFNSDIFVQKLIVKFCPDAVSPTALSQQEATTQYMMIHENGKPNAACGASLSQGRVSGRDTCAQRARTQGWKAFSYGRDDAMGSCYIYEVTIVPTYWQTYSANRTDPPCPAGGWDFNPYFDTYAIDPAR